jgi:hypothetical protein
MRLDVHVDTHVHPHVHVLCVYVHLGVAQFAPCVNNTTARATRLRREATMNSGAERDRIWNQVTVMAGSTRNAH